MVRSQRSEQRGKQGPQTNGRNPSASWHLMTTDLAFFLY